MGHRKMQTHNNEEDPVPPPIHHIHLENFPELPLITWFTFTKTPRIKCPYGVMPESYAETDAEQVEGTEGLYRRPEQRREAVKPSKKAPKGAPMKPTKKGKSKKDCK